MTNNETTYEQLAELFCRSTDEKLTLEAGIKAYAEASYSNECLVRWLANTYEHIEMAPTAAWENFTDTWGDTGSTKLTCSSQQPPT